ncbi:hypothetical protein QBC46DRAFT_375443 [Diplogelasinospora grovesii]|uniref:Uncharacterized protein n=1 Tax=Diplogelasinospora grovesii TaxID=303347 RepID=A0AAN6S7N7_9PEZI|nr:hypothetical protein QBC46DRAFT_375443 [Diplogelasinospora grovesii]
MVFAPPPLPTRFPCWVRAVYSWGGEVCVVPEEDIAMAHGRCLTLTDRRYSQNEISASSRATLSNVLMREMGHGGPEDCGATGERSDCFRPTLSRSFPRRSGRRVDQ